MKNPKGFFLRNLLNLSDQKIKTHQLLLLVLLPGILFWFAWEPMPFTPLVFLAFVPLFGLSNKLKMGRFAPYFFYIFLALLFWNGLTTWWVWFASDVGAIVMLVLNSLLMFIPFGLLRWFERKQVKIQKKSPGSLWMLDAKWLFIVVWVLYEFLHHRWDLSWPWLCLGNSLSGMTWFVQWYEITGTLGGTCVILSINLLIYNYLISESITQGVKKLWPVLSLFISLLLVSIGLYWKAQNHVVGRGEKVYRVGILQPNYDPYEEKFVNSPVSMVMEMWNTSKALFKKEQIPTGRYSNVKATDCMVWPETSLVSLIDVDQLSNRVDPQVNYLEACLRNDYPKRNSPSLMVGANMIRWYSWYNKDRKPAPSAKPSGDPNQWYSLFNSALFMKPKPPGETPVFQYYHKSLLVPGTEQMPFVETFSFIEKLAINLDENSATGTLGKNDRARALGDDVKVAPVICYESIYGDYVSNYVKDGAQWLGIITNDAWWHNTPGYQQHFAYAKLRAIEQRKWVARSANTGMSGFIDPTGRVTMKTRWYQGRQVVPENCVGGGSRGEPLDPNVVLSEFENQKLAPKLINIGNQLAASQNIYLNDEKTIYNRLGDAVILALLSCILLGLSWLNRLRG